MSTFWEQFSNFWSVYGPYIGVTLIPAIITGLSLSPKTAGAVGWVQKIWNGLKIVLDFLSVVSHKDKAGTFQLPLKLGTLLDKKPTDAGPAAALIIVFFFSATQSGCAWWGKHGDEVKQVALDCTTQAAQGKAMPLVNTLVGVLTGGDNYKKQAKVLGEEFGREAVGCAAKFALNKILNPVQSEADPEVVKTTAVARARALEIEEGWVYAD